MSFFRILLSSLLVVCTSVALGHDARPVVIDISELSPNTFTARLKAPPVLASNNFPVLVWPQSCIKPDGQNEPNAGEFWLCSDGLSDQIFSLEYPLSNPTLASYFSVTFMDGSTTEKMLTPSEISWQVEASPSSFNIAGDYTILGFEHILAGLDHLLFVLGLLVISGTAKRILLTVTGFTLAHSISLFLSTFGWVNIPITPVEAVIALSIVFLAHEIARKQRNSWTYRAPAAVSFGFGLLHGLGFASALGEVGLVANDILLSLLFFNIGVELGQLVFITFVVLLYQLFKELYFRLFSQRYSLAESVLNLELVIAYVIGIPAAYWVIDRSGQFLL